MKARVFWLNKGMELVSRQRVILQALWRSGRLSRWELHELTGIRPNTVGVDVAALLDAGILREDYAPRPGRGRPRVPLEIDPTRRHIVGLAVRPGRIQVGRINLLGKLLDEPADDEAQSHALVETGGRLLRERVNRQTLGVGLSLPGFVDPVQHSILFSSAIRGGHEVSLRGLYDAAVGKPMVLENDMHAVAARWLLTHQAQQWEDVLLVYFEDGQLGAALLIDGRPNRGCVTGANELGHTRLPVETELCYCGQSGCLERICSSDFLRRSGGSGRESLADRVAHYEPSDKALDRIIDLLALGFSNAVNFTRVNRLVLVGEFTRHLAFAQKLIEAIRGRMLQEISSRVQIDLWDQPAAHTAETAGWLYLASMFYEGWSKTSSTDRAQS